MFHPMSSNSTLRVEFKPNLFKLKNKLGSNELNLNKLKLKLEYKSLIVLNSNLCLNFKSIRLTNLTNQEKIDINQLK